MITLKQIAKRAGCTVMAASYALRDSNEVGETLRKKVKTIATSLGYAPNTAAQSLRTRKSKLAAIVIDSLRDLTEFKFNTLQSDGFDVLLIFADEGPKNIVAKIKSRHIESVMWLSNRRKPKEIRSYEISRKSADA